LGKYPSFQLLIKILSDDEGEEDYYNKEISMDELEGAVSILKID
jgi:hypothetical protein